MKTDTAFEFASFDRETLQEQIYRELRRALMAGAVRPGQALSNRTLAQMLGTSPMPVRDAIRRLVAERALEALPNRTVIVPSLTEATIDEVYKIRTTLEGLATFEAAARVTKDDIKTLLALENKMECLLAKHDVINYLEANWLFHFSIYELSGMPQLMNIIEGLWLRIGPSISRQRPESHRSVIFSHHHAVIEALEKGNAKEARAAIVRDIKQGAEALKASLEEPSDMPAALPSPKRGRPPKVKAS